MDKYRDILFDLRDGVARITINRPEKYNASASGPSRSTTAPRNRRKADARSAKSGPRFR
jgi:1,4-dihydroxy-2-naphthoyl-CoA synthase